MKHLATYSWVVVDIDSKSGLRSVVLDYVILECLSMKSYVDPSRISG
jgi:hypothetical protein